ncbi:MAG: SBBP repeat-containing protein [Bacteroidetes bacterium]|nr:SBBP repeat-containing protein [Bacteroidota bacterium]
MNKIFLTAVVFITTLISAFSQNPNNRVWGTYIGGSGGESVGNMELDSVNGVLYVLGNTTSRNAGFSTLNAAPTKTNEVGYLAKYSASGARLWSRYISSPNTTSNDHVSDLVYDYSSGYIYVVGHTNGGGMATTGAYQTSNNGLKDFFIQKYDASGNLIWCTYYGGNDQDANADVAVDESGNVYISGNTSSGGLGTAGTYRQTRTDLADGIFAKFNSSGTSLLWASYFGGVGGDYVQDIKVKNGNVIISGTTAASGLATTGAHSINNYGNNDAFIGSFSSTYGTANWITYYGGSYFDIANYIAIDYNDNIYIGGSTNSPANISTSGTYNFIKPSTALFTDGFIAKLNSSGQRQWGTYIGKSASTTNVGYVSIGINNLIYFCGQTDASALATTGAYKSSVSVNDDMLGSIKMSNGQIEYFSYYGGSANEFGESIYTSQFGDVYMFGETGSATTTDIYSTGAQQTTYGGNIDMYLAKFSISTSTSLCTEPTVAPANLIVNNVTSNNANFSYKKGDGDGRFNGTGIGNTNPAFVTSQGANTASIVTGLQPNTCYYVYVFEYSCTGVGTNYLTSTYAVGSFCTSSNLNVGDSLKNRRWATYMSAETSAKIYDIVTDQQGNVIVTGVVIGNFKSRTNPLITTGAYQSSASGSRDAYVAKFNPQGQLLWGTYLGGSGEESGQSIDVDEQGNIYVSGITKSSNFPTTSGAYITSFSGGYEDGFITSFTSGGSLRWSSYFAGSYGGSAMGISVDSINNYVYITGRNQNTQRGSGVGYVAKFNLSGAYQWKTDFDGIGQNLDARNGAVVMVGKTGNTSGIATTGAYQTTQAGDVDAFVASFSTSGSLNWATYYGGSAFEQLNDVVINSTGDIYAIGESSSSFNASSNTYQSTNHGNRNAILVKFNGSGTNKTWDTFFGEENYTEGEGIALDHDESIYISGETSSSNLATNGAYQITNGGSNGYFAKFNANGSRLYSTYYGGSNSDAASSIALDKNDSLFIGGAAYSSTNIASIGSFDNILYGTVDGFLAKFGNPSLIPPVPPCLSPTIATTEAYANANSWDAQLYIGYNGPSGLGNGTNRIIVLYAGNQTVTAPTDGVTYTAYPAPGYGSLIGLGSVIHDGSGAYDFENLFNLVDGTLYIYFIFEYNFCNGVPVYGTNYFHGSFSTPYFVWRWAGGTSNNWNNPKNWSTGKVPGINDSVVIDTIKKYAPVINSIAYAKHLTITKNGKLTINDSLIISRDLTNNSDKVDASNSNATLIFRSMKFPFTHPKLKKYSQYFAGKEELKVSNLVFETDSTLVINNDLRVTGFITPQKGILNANGKIVLVGNTQKTGHILSIPKDASVVGKLKINRLIPSGKAGDTYISSPIAGAILKDLKDDITLNGMKGANPNKTPNVFSYYEPTSGKTDVGFTAAIDANTLMGTGTGWKINVASKPAKIDFNGVVNQGVIQLPITYTSTTYGQANDGWNLVGNPYPCNIDWDVLNGVYKYDMDSTFYIWSSDKGKFVTYNTRLGGTNGGTSVIASQQAFLVKANSKNAYIVLSEGAKTKTNTTFFKKAKAEESILHLTLTNDSGETDEAIIATREGATDLFDNQFDAFKLEGLTHNISTLDFDANTLAAQVFGEVKKDKLIPINIIGIELRDYELSISGIESFSTTDRLFLIDNKYQTSKQLNAEMIILISKDDISSAKNRFGILVKSDKDEEQKSKLISTSKIKIYPNPSSTGFTTIEMSEFENTTLSILDVTGREVTKPIRIQSLKTVLPTQLPAGIYYVKIQSNQISSTHKLIIPK